MIIVHRNKSLNCQKSGKESVRMGDSGGADEGQPRSRSRALGRGWALRLTLPAQNGKSRTRSVISHGALLALSAPPPRSHQRPHSDAARELCERRMQHNFWTPGGVDIRGRRFRDAACPGRLERLDPPEAGERGAKYLRYDSEGENRYYVCGDGLPSPCINQVYFSLMV